MKEIIYKEDAIRAFDCSIGGVPVDSVKYVSEYADKMMSRIMALPSAQSEQRKGEWIEHEDGLILCECSECHEKYMLYEEHVLGRNFCPNCGADMRGGNNAAN